ncbi:MAG: hypothetical protein JST02_02215 [Bacteroidetes bacterium]|nr:hypothetical protein [Bacteroidota bacterium]
MTVKNKRVIHIIFRLAFIAADVFVFILLGVLLMGYEDQYDVSKGEYWSLGSMNTSEKIIYLSFYAWLILNIVAGIFISAGIYRKWKYNRS